MSQSAHSFTEVTQKGCLTRLGEAVGGVVVGVGLFVAAVPLLWWNEGRSVQTYKSLKEGRGAVVSVASDAVDAANEGNLVHVTGHATTDETLTDASFGVSVTALRLFRSVEMYQWVEDQETKKEKKVGGSETTTTTYTYAREWKAGREDSGSFKNPEGHENPPLRFSDESWTASAAQLGAFRLSEALVNKVDAKEKLPFSSDALARLSEELRAEANVDADALYLGASPSEPAVGDLRVRFSRVPPSDVSVIAGQLGGGFTPFQTQAGDALHMLQGGIVPAANMFAQAESENVMLTWLLRLVGFLMMLIGVVLVFRPLRVMADVIPIVGDVVGMGLGLVGFAIAAPTSLLVIALAWVFYRPLLGVALLAVAVALFFGIRSLAMKRKAAAA